MEEGGCVWEGVGERWWIDRVWRRGTRRGRSVAQKAWEHVGRTAPQAGSQGELLEEQRRAGLALAKGGMERDGGGGFCSNGRSGPR